jgi:hypothetical protein
LIERARPRRDRDLCDDSPEIGTTSSQFAR